ncbi:histone-arginine methyltransferase CARMER-like isoform X1 [Physella acuta]|uniref:histone-arginine methyltransferase CARMER-like isoform X1 n=2 Tax=Physella acuta TaxID=109671 RepID=UPI0027DD9EC1|nr:histone-arginine methyltransferase CARMER-like isoform X1 [Physella acuta]XP_059149433.1 histone-arginine methyltransferase CARMER-like isoform X1 [Physella acuta]XP_059149434.1 histone-arginine methyltransferase CARMER-like isoform X1 [Physella acuta]
MATTFENVRFGTYGEDGKLREMVDLPHKMEITEEQESLVVNLYNGNNRTNCVFIGKETEVARIGNSSLVVTNDNSSVLLAFPTIHMMRAFRQKLTKLKEGMKSVFTERTEEASAVQYFQFYGYLSQQQNMMQDYIRTSTYQRAMLANISDFHDKIVLDVGAGSGILSFFAIQAGAKKVYAIEASSMAQHCETLVRQNNLSDRIIVIPGKVEEVDVPEEVDTIISEPMGYMLFNERMLESYLHAKKWLKQEGRMFPTQGDLHIAPFTDEALYMEQYQKANFWYQESFHGVNLTSLRSAAVAEYFKQPIVDTFDIRICLAKSNKYVIDFQSADETDLHVMEIPLTFTMLQSGMVHGLAFWFDCGFLGSDYSVWLSTAPTEPLTHWYQVRCLVQTPVLVKQGQTLTGLVKLTSNTRQSYDVDIELNIPGTNNKSVNCLDLKNPFFRYTGTAPAPPPGSNQTSATDSYWNNLMASGDTQQQQTYVNGFVNGIVDVGQVLVQQPHLQQQGVVQGNLIAMSEEVISRSEAQTAPINPGSIPSVGIITSNANAHRTSIGAGISPISFSSQNVITGSTNHFPVSSQFMIGDYVMPGNLIIQSPKSET